MGSFDGEKLLSLIGDVQGTLDLAQLREEMLTALVGAVPCEWASLNDIGGDPGATVVLNRPPLPRKWHEEFARLSYQNPLLVQWLQTRDGRPYRFSDVATPAAMAELELFQRVYGPLGIRHQIAFTLPSPSDRVLAVALSRREPDFTDAERDLLLRARPFLIQAYRNALHVATLTGGAKGAVDLLRAEGLTRRQAQVLVALSRGQSDRDIAAAWGLSHRTVQKHLQHAYRFLGVDSRSAAAARVWSLTTGGSTAGAPIRPPATPPATPPSAQPAAPRA